MRAVVQRVSGASVDVDATCVGAIENGLLAYVGAMRGDTTDDVRYLADKLANLRIFEDHAGKFARSVIDVSGAVLVVSQFTLFGDVRRGRRPSFEDAAPPEAAEALLGDLVADLVARGIRIATGRFRASMLVHADVRGPVTILLDSRRAF